MEKKALPVSAGNKGFEEDETFGTASVEVEQLKPMNIDERLMCILFPIRLSVTVLTSTAWVITSAGTLPPCPDY